MIVDCRHLYFILVCSDKMLRPSAFFHLHETENAVMQIPVLNTLGSLQGHKIEVAVALTISSPFPVMYQNMTGECCDISICKTS